MVQCGYHAAGGGPAGGILTLARVVGHHWHALVRDVMSMGYRASDIFKELSMGEVLSIILGAGPDSSVRNVLDGGWSREAHLLANLQESTVGLATLNEPYSRPGLDARPKADRGRDILHGEAMTWEEMDALDKRRAEATQAGTIKKTTPTRKAVW